MVKIKKKQIMLTNFEKKVNNAFLELLKTNSVITTLDIKNKLRTDDPSGRYYQNEVSEAMQIITTNNSTISYNDNGTYREYSVVQVQPVSTTNTTRVSKKEVVKILRANVGKFFGITFVKKDGTVRTLNGHMSNLKFITDLGYLQVITNKKEFKQVDPKNILELSINGIKYVVK